MHKEAILKRYQACVDKDGQFLKALDQLAAADAYYEAGCTDFLSPDCHAAICEIAKFETDVTVTTFGAFKAFERARLFLTPPYQEPDAAFEHIALIEIDYPQKFVTLGHKDVLGALMGLGINRSKVGDIVKTPNGFQVAVSKALAPYLALHFDQVARARVKVTEVPLEAAYEVVIEFETVSGTVGAMRLDSVLALGHRLSRSEAKTLIEAGQVKRNHRVETLGAKSVDVGDLISCRGYGRFIVAEISGETKKKRLHVTLNKYPKK